MEKYVRSENIARYRKLLLEAPEGTLRDQILRLLCEEEKLIAKEEGKNQRPES